MATKNFKSKKDTNERASLVIKFSLDSHKLKDFLGLPRDSLPHQQNSGDPYFATSSNVVRDLSPIRGAIRTPASALACAPVLNRDLKSRTVTKEHTSNQSLQLGADISEKRKYEDSVLGSDSELRALSPKRQCLPKRCEGCHTQEALNLGYWILNSPPRNEVRDVDMLNRVCVHKLRHAMTMADAMLRNAQRDHATLRAEYDSLQAQHFSNQRSEGFLGPWLNGTSSEAAIESSTSAPALMAPFLNLEQQTQPFSALGLQQGPHAEEANNKYAQAFLFLKQHIPQLADHELDNALQHVFQAARTYTINMDAAGAFQEGFAQGKKVGTLEGWNACEQRESPDHNDEAANIDMRIMIMNSCLERDELMRDLERLEKLIAMLRASS